LTSPSLDDLKQAKWRLAVDVLAGTETWETRIHALERVQPPAQGKAAQFLPIRFVRNNKLEREDKMLLGFDALALSGLLGRKIDFGRIVHGDEPEAMKVKTTALVGEVRKLTEKLAALLSSASPPDPILKRHCGECEFQARCKLCRMRRKRGVISLLCSRP
jgi:CRISPR/Cas system-associated exonuclease Cas4 (RecB family)